MNKDISDSSDKRNNYPQDDKFKSFFHQIVQEGRIWPRTAFIVHGHDGEAKEKVARFLDQIDIKPIILHEQSAGNRTIIENIEKHGNVGFAIILLTPDDEGAKKGDAIQPRARQNVILELGYFVGRLGRDRVCALMRGKVEVPSDFGGVTYHVFDDHGGWKTKVAKELEEANYVVDWSKVHI